MQVATRKPANIFIVGRLYAGLERIGRLLMLIRGRDEKSFSNVFVSISGMLVCLGRKSWSICHTVGGN